MPIKVLSAEQAMASKSHPAAAWPRTPEAQATRLSPFCLPTLSPSFLMTAEDPIFTIGSCFARNVEKQLLIEGYNALAGQFPAICEDVGVSVKPDILNKFVAGSILNEVRWALDPDCPYDERSIVKVKDGRYVDMQLAPGLLPMSMDQMLGIRQAVSRYMATLKDARIVIITLGLAEAWYDRDTGLYLNSPPHRGSLALYPDRFEMHVLDYQDITSALEGVVETIARYGRPDAKILLTVSPVALGMTWTSSDALIANTYSKAVQRAAAGYIVAKYDQVDYMPSFESVTLSDRSMAWREDQAHASDEAVRINVMRMIAAYSDKLDDAAETQARALALHKSRDMTDLNALIHTRDISPDDVLVRFRLGKAFYHADRFEEAVTELAQSRRLGGDHYGADYLLAKALFRCGRFAEAVEPIQSTIARDPELPGPPALLEKAQMLADRSQPVT